MEILLNYLQNHKMLVVVAMVILLDTILGSILSVKEKKTVSSIGIDGMTRKVSMIACLSFLVVFDFIIKLDLIGWLPSQILEIFKTFGINTVGISDLFALLFIAFELLSVLKNWMLLGLPMFKGVNEKVTGFLETFTDEMPTTNKNK